MKARLRSTRSATSRALALSAAVASATIGVVVAAPTQANAGTFTQEWRNSATSRASRDFIPNTNRVWAWGMACAAGDAIAFQVQVKRTTDGHIMLTTSNRTVNDNWIKIDDIGVSSGTAYYLKWYGWGKDSAGAWSLGYSAPCQGVQATW